MADDDKDEQQDPATAGGQATSADGGSPEPRSADEGDGTEDGADISDTDIVFDCPHCGHSLAIDYRGAGLQINCVNCGEPVLVPIPDGMKIADLDLEPGEILKQLFATRRITQKSEARVAELEEEVAALTERRDALEKSRALTLQHCGELVAMCQGGLRLENEVSTVLGRMVALLEGEQKRG